MFGVLGGFIELYARDFTLRLFEKQVPKLGKTTPQSMVFIFLVLGFKPQVGLNFKLPNGTL